MSDALTQLSRNIQRRIRPDPWSVGALVIALVVLAPVVAVVWFAFHPTENIWPHLLSTTLPRYMGNTLVLMGAVGLVTAMIGTVTAWLVTMYHFPGRSWLQWALLLPLAVPAYVGAYALVDFLEYAGPVQTGLRNLFGWETSRDYWFPQIRTRGAAIVVLSAALYPYVYLLARAAFREQSGAGYEVARALGVGPVGRFLRVGLPLARPAIAAGVAVVMMETVNDFGTVDYFAVQTLTTGIFSVWLQAGNLGGAAQIASVLLILIVVLVTLEKISRRRSRFYSSARSRRPIMMQSLSGVRGWIAFAACVLPFVAGFVVPVAVLLSHAFESSNWLAPGLRRALLHTLSVGGIAAVVTVLGGLFMVYGVRLSGRRLPALLLPVTAIGYAAPGAVLAIGILIPLATIDNRLADAILVVTGTDPGLILTGTAFAVGLSYVVRFFAIAQGAADAALGRVPQSLPLAARSLGRTAGGTLRAIHLPLIRASLGSALLLVFVDCVKELPATLLLRPFGYDTLATRVHAKASLENIADAAPAALTITLVGLVAVGFLARSNR
ncbi:iron ABC transporter permease [Ponticoccus sp. SC2-23]|uniref:ABC transporter permease n=1 Tax=Alexandriicola marinus TaxID=2081710 RepID=UPI000FDA3EA2|nr:iron ABC transporter permease [Alexandriicola marinus]MBM1219523.1 iron ABC transporter permease [Ponticoccus sp. SC6-9]MBM1223405.1 iron ABC transporter permease [Ponticoccus sp. SC6-15]MBM1229336.1 iron ABC transporter permease [Ponticoccus sp. SC6-38]MBM1232371.1 iron ABC transporter permease [Ponticoccus sp. SC6-45]MBM1237679.1 iron ABC transporter permease [Ponticoccus sp. SC6-49]MBM1241382.1 iron ABC transporter permease [Ponticoccus sp. SC2-64]MBM1245895.1 iron ABC transporter perm